MPQSVISLPDEEGIDLKPGSLTSIGLTLSEITRQPAPYPSKCIGEWNQTTIGEDDRKHVLPFLKYSQVKTDIYYYMLL